MRTTRERTDIEQALAELRKVVRAAVRAKYSALAEREIYRLLPEYEQQLIEGYQRGEAVEFDTSELFALPAGAS